LTANSPGTAPSFQAVAGGSGDLVLLNTQTAATSATLTFTSTYITNTYGAYLIIFNDIRPDANQDNTFQFLASEDNGSTYLNTGYSAGVNSAIYTSATLANVNSTTAAIISDDAVYYNYSGYIYLNNRQGLDNMYWRGQATAVNSATVTFQDIFGGILGSALAVNNIQFSFTTSNILAGSISLYGIAQ
jgi:hypothetical protein